MNTQSRYLIFDAQYALVRQWSMLKSQYKDWQPIVDSNSNPILDKDGNLIYKECHTYTWQELVKRFFWAIGKVTRDLCSAEKVILLWDKAPYHKVTILGAYKDSREYHDYEELNSCTNPSDKAYLEEWISDNDKKNTAKQFIINNLGQLGMISIIHQGYEADDLAYLCSQYLKEDDEPSTICSSDNDWYYWGSENVDTMTFKGERWTYQQTKQWEVDNIHAIPEQDLFTIKSIYDSLHGSHNDLRRSIIKSNVWYDVQYNQILNKDFSNVDKDIFEKNMKSFDIYHYPKIDEVLKDIDNKIRHYGSIGTTDTKCELLNSNGINVSNSYYETFISNLNNKWYEGIN